MDSPTHRKRRTPHDFDSPSALNKSSPGKIESNQQEVDDFFENFQQQINVQFVNLKENITDCGVQAKQCLEKIFAMEERKNQQIQSHSITRGLSLQQDIHQNQKKVESISKYQSEKNNNYLIAPSSNYQKELIKLNPVEQAPLLPTIVHRFRAKTINQNNINNHINKETQERFNIEDDNNNLIQKYDCNLDDKNSILTTRDHKLQRQRILSLQAHPSANHIPSMQKQVLKPSINKHWIQEEEGAFPMISDNMNKIVQATQLKQEKLNKLQRQLTQQPSPPSLNSGLNQPLPSQASNYSISRLPGHCLKTASTFDESSTFNQTESLVSQMKLLPDQIHSKNNLKYQQLSEQNQPVLDHHQPIKKKIIKISKESAFSKIIDQDFSSSQSSRIPYLSPTQASNPSQDKQFNLITQDSMQFGSAKQNFKILKIIKTIGSKQQQPNIVKQSLNNEEKSDKLNGFINQFDEDKENEELNSSNPQKSQQSGAIQEKTNIERYSNNNLNILQNRCFSGGQRSEKSLLDKQQLDQLLQSSNNPAIEGTKCFNKNITNNNLYDIDHLSELADSLNRKKIKHQGPLSFANSRLLQPGYFNLQRENQIKLQLNKSRLNSNTSSSSFVAPKSCLQNLVIQDIDDFKSKFKI